MNKVIVRSLQKALLELSRSMMGVEIKNLNQVEHTSEETSGVSGIMVLNGNNAALLTINMPFLLLKKLVNNMTGSSDVSDDDILDGMAEIVNITAGTVKTLLAGTEWYYSLTSPLVVQGDDFRLFCRGQASRVKLQGEFLGSKLSISFAYMR